LRLGAEFERVLSLIQELLDAPNAHKGRRAQIARNSVQPAGAAKRLNP